MELTHSFTVPASVEHTWATFMDLQEVGSCFPGATVTDVTGDGFAGTVKVKLGPIALVYSGSGSFVERDDEAHRAVIDAKGKDKRGNGTAGATVTIQLTDAGDGTTRADVQTDLNVTGKPAQFGRGVMQDVSDKLLGQFVGCIEGKVAGPPAAAAPASPSDEEVAAAPTVATPVVNGSTGAGPAPVPSSPVAGKTPTPAREAESLDLGATVLPVVLRSYATQIAGAVAALVVLVVVVRSLRRRRG
ncbi:SRPBCC family protein [Phycicoccus sp. Soil748]|uniref:SRPBCC family protein n=1 Tax=Intrasporangiaceae TaxID=85021 RepID=UPI000702AEAA|nr:SRPBCC family protein [Phycicoccus sp. Soil748]KRE58710.1 carbon monoxide dehydrogenase [Phycicoccus sp. Soil748]